MKEINRKFLQILKHALRKDALLTLEETTAEEWVEILRMAETHHVLAVVYDSVYALLEEKLNAAIRRSVLQQILVQTMKTEEFFRMYERLLEAGARPLVVKGLICRELYPQPDARISGDEDLLITEAEYENCHSVLVEGGMQTEDSDEVRKSAYEVPYRKAGGKLYIELHKQLFAPESDLFGDWNRLFEGANERAVSVTVQGHTVYTMAPTDHLLYLIVHAFKHFLHSGFGIRQVSDIILYAQNYGSQIDWERIDRGCRDIHAKTFAATLFRIGEKYLGFDRTRAAYPEDWNRDAVEEEMMLKDLLGGGVFGDSSLNRKHSSQMTLDAAAAHKKGKKASGSVLGSIFPGRKNLVGKYPWLKKHPYLLPVAWGIRIFRYGRELRSKTGSHAGEAWQIGNQRVELLRKYRVIS